VLTAALFIADTNMAGLLRRLAGESNEFAIGSIVELTTVGYAVARTLSTSMPDVILMEMTDLDRDLPQAAKIHQQAPRIPLVGLASKDIQQALSRSASSDFTSLVVWPFTATELEQAISGAIHKLHGGIFENLLAFVPGKAGSGASTVVLHTALILAQELKRRVLVIEGDLHSGLLSEMLSVKPKHSIRDVLAEASRIDNMGWQGFVTSVGGVDFLLTKPEVKTPVPSWAHYFQMLHFAAEKYDLVLADLPEVVNPATAEIVRTARAVYVVSTPEIASLQLSKQRCEELHNWGVERGRIQALLNRGHKSDIAAPEAAQILGCPVAATFPNDYRTLKRATTDGGLLDKRSDLGAAYLKFSRILTGAEVEKKSWFR
jgi:MinD-like ATPase involved in chromosome partitioning or flagellar assembly/CheY-like chemotaxis protein